MDKIVAFNVVILTLTITIDTALLINSIDPTNTDAN